MSQWIQHVKQYAKTHHCSYKDALKLSRSSYKSKGSGIKTNIDENRNKVNHHNQLESLLEKFRNEFRRVIQDPTLIENLINQALSIANAVGFNGYRYITEVTNYLNNVFQNHRSVNNLLNVFIKIFPLIVNANNMAILDPIYN